jgi:hypothetical protein
MTILPQARAMSRNELKSFRATGLDPVFFDSTNDNQLSFLKLTVLGNDWILDNIYKEHDFNDVPNNQLVELAEKTFRLTYGLEKEVKNS